MTIVTGTDGKQYNVTVTLNPAAVTDATLKLSADGQEVSVVQGTKTDATVTSITVAPVVVASPPVVTSSPTPVSVAPAMAKFTNVPQQSLKLSDGSSWNVQTAANAYALSQAGQSALRFEVRHGDAAWYDNARIVERSEIRCATQYKSGTKITSNFQFNIDPGTPSTAGWLLFHEWHNDDITANVTTSPPVSIGLLPGDRLVAWVRGGQAMTNAPAKTVYQDTKAIARGVAHTVQIEMVCDKASGYLKISLDGNQIVNYAGPVGYGFDTYCMEGIYRAPAAETFAITLSNPNNTAA